MRVVNSGQEYGLWGGEERGGRYMDLDSVQ